MSGRTISSIALMCAMGLNGCAYQGQGPNEQSGMVIGGILGGILGSEVDEHHGSTRTAAIILGTMAGAAVGGSIGRSMDQRDRLNTAYALENVRTGVPSSWQNPDTGNAYAVTPTRTYDTGIGPCREYTVDARIGGGVEKLYGTACRQPDGTWKVQN